MAKLKRTKGQNTQWRNKKEQKDRTHNGQAKKNKRTNINPQIIT